MRIDPITDSFSTDMFVVICILCSKIGVCGTRWKQNGRVRTPKNIIQGLFCEIGVQMKGNERKRETEWSVCELGW